MTSFNLNDLHTGPVFKCNHSGVRTSTYEPGEGRDTSQFIMKALNAFSTQKTLIHILFIVVYIING